MENFFMLTSERTQQLTCLLSTILQFAGNIISIRDASLIAFSITAEKFDITDETVRDMVTRSCDIEDIMTFYHAVEKLYEGDTVTFNSLYFSHIPDICHSDIDYLCRKFAHAEKPTPASVPAAASFLKNFARSRDTGEKRALLNLLRTDKRP